MNKIKFTIYGLLLVAGGFSVSCSKSDPAPALVASTRRDLPADPPSGGFNPTNGQAIGVTNKYTLFNFENNTIIANVDSVTASWDIGFNATSIIVNSGTSGPGTASAQLVTGVFADLNLAPDTGYLVDNKNAVPPSYAIPRGSGKGWYAIDQNLVTPIAGKVLMIQTCGGKYVKMEIISYYKGAPVSPTSASAARYYTFRYIYQPDGTKKLQ